MVATKMVTRTPINKSGSKRNGEVVMAMAMVTATATMTAGGSGSGSSGETTMLAMSPAATAMARMAVIAATM